MFQNTTNDNKKVIHFEELPVDMATESLVGRKGQSLFRLHNFDTPVPDFFAITPSVFFQFTSRVLKEKKKEIDSMKESIEGRDVAMMFSRFDFDNDVVTDVVRNYTKLSGFTDAWVSVRSSVSFPKRPEVTFSGIFDTQLNVRGVDNLLKSIKQVYSSVFTDEVVKYCVNEGIDLSEVGLAIVVQKMVQPEVSGVAYTVDPITQDESRISVEAVYGLGDVISNGDITPDSYTLLKKDLALVEKHIAPQEWMRVRTLKAGGVNTSEKIQISPSWSHRQKLEDRYIVEISKIGLRLEEQMGEALDIEWVLSGGRVWILQAKNTYARQSIVSNIQIGYTNFVSDSLYKVLKDILSGYEDSQELERKAVEEAAKYVEKGRDVVNVKTKVKSPIHISTKIPKVKGNEEILLTGIGASFGVVDGEVLVVTGDGIDATKVGKGNILVMKKYEKSYYPAVVNAGGVVTDTGGLTSDIAILCRELNTPAIVGTTVGTAQLKSGDSVKLDGNSGSLYRVDVTKSEQHDVGRDIAKRLEENVNNGKVDLPVDKEKSNDTIAPKSVAGGNSRDLDLPHTATKVFTSNLDPAVVVNSDGVMYVSLDYLMVENGRHPLAYLADKKYVEYAEKIGKEIDTIATLASPQEVVVSLGEVSVGKFKKLVKGKEYETSDLPDRAMGASRLLASPKLMDLSLKIVKRVRNKMSNRNVSLAIHTPLNGTVMKEIKKSVSASGLRRTSTFKVYSVIENPSEIIVLDDILSADIDGVILNLPSIAKQMLGLSYDSSGTKYDLNVSSILKVIDSVSDVCKKHQVKLSVVVENDLDVIKYCVSKGVYGVVVTSDVISVKKAVSEQEMKILMGR